MKYIKLFEGKKLINPFVQAAKRGSSAKIKEMIKKVVDINIKDSEIPNNTALMEACLNRFLLVETTLLEAGADPNIQNLHGRTALMMASTMKAIDILLEYNADVNIQNYFTADTAIMEYLDFGFLDNQIITIIEKFRNHKLNLDLKNKSNFNFYEKSKYLENKLLGSKNKYTPIIKYMDENFPKYKEEWDFQNDVNKYNV